MTRDPSDVVDTFSPAWMAGYVIGRRPHGPSELPAARDRATEIGGAESFDDGYDTGKAAAARLPHHVTLHDYRLETPIDGSTLEVQLEQLAPGSEAGVFTADPAFVEGCDEDGMRLWSANGRIESADWNSGRTTVYIEAVFL